MATNTLQASGVDNNWSTAGNWTLGRKPNATDDVVMNIDFDVTLDENTAALVSLSMINYAGTLSMGNNNIDVQGNATLGGTITGNASNAQIFCGGNLFILSGTSLDTDIDIVMDGTTGSLSITSNVVTLGALTIDDAAGDAIFAMQDALTCGAFVLTDGDFRTADFAFSPAGISGAGGELAFGTSTVNAGADDITLDNIAATISTGALTAGNLEIGAAGSLTSSDDFTVVADVLLDDGTLDIAGDDLVITGNLVTTSGTLTNTGGTVTVSGDLDCALAATHTNMSVVLSGTGNCEFADWTTPLLSLTCAAAGQTTTWVNITFMKKLVLGPGATAGSGEANLRFPTVNDFIDQDADNTFVVGTLEIGNHDTALTQKAIDVTATTVEIKNRGGNALTMTGDLDCNSSGLRLEASSTGHVSTLTMGIYKLICGAVTLGHASLDRSGILNCGKGIVTVASVASTNAANLGNELNLQNCHFECSGNLDADNVTLSGDNTFPPEMVFGPGGEILNTADKNVNTPIAVFGDASVAGANNHANITSYTNNQSYPGSLLTLGAGGGRVVVPFWLMMMGTFLKMMMEIF